MDRVLYCIWFGKEMSDVRRSCLDKLYTTSNVQVVLITEENLHCFILKDHPLHEGFQYLSEVHKSDYLRTYLMHFYGGGYSDIKPLPIDWNPYFDLLETSDAFGIGSPDPMVDNYEKLKELNMHKHWTSLDFYSFLNVGFFIFKPQTEFTEKWYNSLLQKMNEKLEMLKKYPARNAYESDFGYFIAKRQTKYPIHWVEIMAEIFHPLCAEFKGNLLNTFYVLKTNTKEYR
jgi:hypothetical protein